MKPCRVKSIILLTILILVMFAEHAGAQKKYRFFYGKVYDRVTRRPVSNVNFSVENTKVGTMSDGKGNFSFYIDTIPSIMTISHVGYATRRVILDTASYNMTLYLTPVTTLLQEVVISAKPQELIFKDKHYAVLDYEIDSGFVYLLIYRYRFSKAQVICRTPGGDTIAQSGLLSFTPRNILCDCIGYLHILSDDSAYQVFRKNDSLKMIHPVTLKKYYEILGDCVASAGDLLYFKMSTNFGLGTEFYTVNRKDKTRKMVSQVRDEKKMKMLRNNPEDFWLLTSGVQHDADATKMSEERGDVKSMNQATTGWMWVRKIQYPPVKSFLYRIGEFICVFNTAGKQMEFFDLDGNYSYKLQLKADQPGEGRWTNEILIDEFTLRIYTTFLKNGTISLFEIDLNTGEFIKKCSLFHLFPQKLSVYDHYLYYLYDDPISPDNKMLYRQRL